VVFWNSEKMCGKRPSLPNKPTKPFSNFYASPSGFSGFIKICIENHKHLYQNNKDEQLFNYHIPQTLQETIKSDSKFHIISEVPNSLFHFSLL